MSGPREPRQPPSLALWLSCAPLILFLGLPLVALLGLLPPGTLLEHLASAAALQALWLSIRTTCTATALAILLGTPIAYLLARGSFRGRELLDTLIDLPITIPPVVAGVALLLTFGRRGLLGRYFELLGFQIAFTRLAVVLAQLFIACPFFVKSARSAFAGIDVRLFEVARTLGASEWHAFWTVAVPLARPALLAGVVLTWARALSEFGATMMFAGNFPGRTQTLPLAVMTALESDLDTAIAVSVLSLLLGLGALLAAKAWVGGAARV